MVHVSLVTSDGHQLSARILYTYDIAANGFSVVLSEDEMETVKKLPGFLLAYGDRQVTVDTTHTFEFLSLNPVTGLRPASDYRKDVIVGVLDSKRAQTILWKRKGEKLRKGGVKGEVIVMEKERLREMGGCVESG
ncbi:hypothetical protein RHSIM_Rhsim06G0107600 [Rhododendron simsii]|uniref:Inhibitor I9 domain-containing protein n=1 Tax=Rhododendron simsii TaxID=118357 RepID=A0A834GVU3_RHOSS|nr:hypothetical protein RHSIM_Rhsim06G0107600 [Rhododendron simsii]